MLDAYSEASNSANISGVSTQRERLQDCKKVEIFINVIYDIMKIYGFINGVEKSLSKEDSTYLKSKTQLEKLRLRNRILEFVYKTGFGSWKDFFKYKINAFFSWVMDQEVPPAPAGLDLYQDLIQPSFLIYGRGKRFVRNMNRKKLESFAQSIAQSKKAAPAVSEDMVSEAEYKCWKHLTTERLDEPDFVINDGIFEQPINRNVICYQLRRTVREVFGGKKPVWDELTKPFVPSTSSQYNFNRKNMGAVGAFLSNPSISEKISGCEAKVSMKVDSVLLKGELTELYGSAGREEQERIDRDFENIMTKDTLGVHFDGEKLCEFWKDDIYPTLIEEALREEPKTIVIGLPEPFKVRCITAGPPLTYTALKPIQEWLWGVLKEESVFQLIGTPVTEEIVMKQMGRLGLDEDFISGDYKASTDNLHSWVSECLLDALMECISETLIGLDDPNDPLRRWLPMIENLMKRALTGHSILNPKYNEIYRKGMDEIPEDGFQPQKEGQLMGSVISFPFLCLANAALCRFAMEVSDLKNYKIVDRYIEGYETARLLINGDDCVFPGKNGIFLKWKQIAAFGGLESSVGKTFCAKDFMTINSCQFSYSESTFSWEDYSGLISDFVYETIKYVNMGLVYCQKKDGTRGKPFYRMGAVHRDLEKTCPPELFKAASNVFLKEAKKTKFRFATDKFGKKIIGSDGEYVMCEMKFHNIREAKVPYYLPEWLGGVGLVPDKALFLQQENVLSIMGALEIRDSMAEVWVPRTQKESDEWRFHKFYNDSMIDYRFLEHQNFVDVEFDGTTRDLSMEEEKLYGLQIVALMFQNTLDKLRVSLDHKQEEKHMLEVALHNQRAWNRVRDPSRQWNLKKMWLRYDPETLYKDLLYEKKHFSLSCFDVREAKLAAFPVHVNRDQPRAVPEDLSLI